MRATTEQLHQNAIGLDQQSTGDVAALLVQSQIAAASVVASAAPQIAQGAARMAHTIGTGGTLYYVAAGSSGLMAAADAQELGGTFSIPAHQLRIVMAGGLPTGVEMPGDTEDQTDETLDQVQPNDTVIAVSASGSTPFTLHAARIATAAGAHVIGIANNPDTPLLQLADIPILLPTPPEILSGSTRLGAGTAQKIALNSLSTAMAVELGHVHDGMMINLRADNAKLRGRAEAIVSHIAAVDAATARDALRQAGGEVKPATLIAARTIPLPQAQSLLAKTGGRLRAALTEQP